MGRMERGKVSICFEETRDGDELGSAAEIMHGSHMTYIFSPLNTARSGLTAPSSGADRPTYVHI